MQKSKAIIIGTKDHKHSIFANTDLTKHKKPKNALNKDIEPTLEYEQFSFNRREFFELLKSPHMAKKKEHMQKIKNIYYESVKRDLEYIKERKIAQDEEKNNEKMKLLLGKDKDQSHDIIMEESKKSPRFRVSKTFNISPITRPPNMQNLNGNRHSIRDYYKDAFEFVKDRLNDGKKLRFLFNENGEFTSEGNIIPPFQSFNTNKGKKIDIERTINDEDNFLRNQEEKMMRSKELLKVVKNRVQKFYMGGLNNLNQQIIPHETSPKYDSLSQHQNYVNRLQNTSASTGRSSDIETIDTHSTLYLPDTFKEMKNSTSLRGIDINDHQEISREVDTKLKELPEESFEQDINDHDIHNEGIGFKDKEMRSNKTIEINSLDHVISHKISNGSNNNNHHHHHLKNIRSMKNIKSIDLHSTVNPLSKTQNILIKIGANFETPINKQTKSEIITQTYPKRCLKDYHIKMPSQNILFSPNNSNVNAPQKQFLNRNIKTAKLPSQDMTLSSRSNINSGHKESTHRSITTAKTYIRENSFLNNKSYSHLSPSIKDCWITPKNISNGHSQGKLITYGLTEEKIKNYNMFKNKCKETQETVQSQLLKEINILCGNSESATKKSVEKLLVSKKLRFYALKLQERMGKKIEKTNIPKTRWEFKTLQNIIDSKQFE